MIPAIPKMGVYSMGILQFAMMVMRAQRETFATTVFAVEPLERLNVRMEMLAHPQVVTPHRAAF